jgi:hypothetical protein
VRDDSSVHRHPVESSATLGSGFDGQVGDVFVAAFGVVTEGEMVTFATFDISYPIAHVRRTNHGAGALSDTLAVTRLFEFGPGTNPIAIQIQNAGTLELFWTFHALTVRHFGDTCGGQGAGLPFGVLGDEPAPSGTTEIGREAATGMHVPCRVG